MTDYSSETSPVDNVETRDSVRQRIFIVVLVATMGALAFGYDTGIISGSLPFMSAAPSQGGLGLTSFTEGLVASSLGSFQWICNATVAFAFPLMLSLIGNQTFFLFVLLNIGSFLFVYFLLPETRGKSLEEIENMMRSKYGEV